MKGYEIEQHEAHAAIVITSSCMHGWQRGLPAHHVQSRIDGLETNSALPAPLHGIHLICVATFLYVSHICVHMCRNLCP